jgi:hypothetical protein
MEGKDTSWRALHILFLYGSHQLINHFLFFFMGVLDHPSTVPVADGTYVFENQLGRR